MTELGKYIFRLCERQNLSMRQASRRAGLDSTTISQIVRRGKSSTPRPDTLRLIAEALGGDYMYMLRLAGHLPPRPANPEHQGIVFHRFETVAQILSHLPEDLQLQLADQILAQVKTARVLYEARPEYDPRAEESKEKNTEPSS